MRGSPPCGRQLHVSRCICRTRRLIRGRTRRDFSRGYSILPPARSTTHFFGKCEERDRERHARCPRGLPRRFGASPGKPGFERRLRAATAAAPRSGRLFRSQRVCLCRSLAFDPKGWQLPSLPRRNVVRAGENLRNGESLGTLDGGLGCFPLD